MPHVTIGMLKVNKNTFGPDSSNRITEFGMTVMQADAVLRAQQAGRPGVRMLLAPEYFWSGYGEIGQRYRQQGALAMTRGAKHGLYSGLKKISSKAGSLVLVAGSIFYQKSDGTRTVAYNLCPVLRGGKFLLKAYKDFDNGTAGKISADLVYDTKSSDPFFSVEGVNFGLEVCGDHNSVGGKGGKLKRWNASANKAIDVHILVSDSMTVLAGSVAARPGGYVAQCDIGGADMGIAVYPAGGPYDRNSALPASGISSAQVNGGSIVYYSLAV
jgi:predicted amidohydrolase